MARTGRPSYKPTLKKRAQCIDFVCLGYTHETIAKFFHVDCETLRKYYREELDNGASHRTHKLIRALYIDALAGHKPSREFWLKTVGKMAFAKTVEERDKDDKVVSLLEQLNANIKKADVIHGT